MPTEDQFVTVPLNSGINLKTDEFTTQPPRLRESKNVNNEGELGSANFLPRLIDLTDVNPNQGQLALVPGADTICMLKKDSAPILYNKAGSSWNTTAITTGAVSADIVGDFIITSLRPITEIAHGSTDTFDVYAWLETDADGVEGGIGRYIVRSQGSNIGPFDIPVDAAPLVNFSAIALTRGTTECYLYVYEVGATNEVVGYRIDANGVAAKSNNVATLTGTQGAIDVVEDPAVDANRRHHLAVTHDQSAASWAIYQIDAFGTVVVNIVSGTLNVTGTGIAIDFNGANIASAVIGGNLQGIRFVHYDPADFAGRVTSDAGSVDLARIALRWSSPDNQFLCMADERKTVNGVSINSAEQVSLYKIDDTTGLGTSIGFPRQGMRLTGDPYVDENGGVIFPLTLTRPNFTTHSQPETNLVRATWPSDPAIVGYLFNLKDFDGSGFALHPISRWGTDRVRTQWGRSKLSMPYAADPTTVEQIYGRSLLDVSLLQRKTGSHVLLSNGASLFGTSVPQIFDGRNFIPAGHLWRPQIGSGLGIGGGSTLAGTYSYRCVFIWEDDTGLLIRSADSGPVEAVLGADEALQIVVKSHQPPHSDSTTETRLRMWTYATEDGGTNFFLLTDTDGNVAEANYQPNSNTFQLVISDGAGDPSNPILTFQTVPPEIAPQTPNGFIDVISVHNRAWGIDAEDRDRVWFSKVMSRFQAPEFSSQLVVDFPDEDGPLTALGVVNANPVFFKKKSIWAIQGGEGPSNVIGLGGAYSRPVKLVSVGTTNRRSVVSFPGGVAFHNGRSLMLLNQGYQVQPFGLEIQPATLGGIIDAVHVTGRRELHFNFDDGTGGFRHFVYNYDVDIWAEWPDTDFSFIDQIVSVNSRIFLIDGDRGETIQMKEAVESGVQSFEQDADLGTVRDVPDMVIKTAWIRPGDRNAARRVREVLLEFEKTGQPVSGDLGVEIDEEHGQGGKSLSWTAAEIDAAYPNTLSERVILRVVPEEQLESISVQVTIPVTMNLKPVSCSVLFGIEEGVQRRYPEGSTK